MITTYNQVAPEQALEAYINADGNIHLASERLHISPTQFTEILSQDYVGIQRLLRTKTLLSMYTAFEHSQAELGKSIGMMEPQDVAKTFIGVATILEKLTANSQNVTLNIHEYMMKMLPPDVREALTVLTAPPSESHIILDNDD